MIEAFDLHLAGLALRLEAVVIGGVALARRDHQADARLRHPRAGAPGGDCRSGAGLCSSAAQPGVELIDDWFNNGPIQLGEVLPAGW